MNLDTKSLSPQSIIETAKEFQKSRILLTAIELKIFTILGTHLMTAAEIAEELNYKTEPLERLMNALTALGFLRKTKGKFYNEKHSFKFLAESSDEFIHSLKHLVYIWEKWNNLTDKITDEPPENETTEAFINAMHYRARKQASVFPYLIDLKKVNRILDVGGGSGVFSMALMKAKPGIKATLLDLPNVIPIAKSIIEREGFSEYFQFIEESYHTANFGSGYNLIILSAVLHINSAEENKRIIEKCSNALNDGGEIAINEFILSENGTEPIDAAIFSINMLVATEKGRSYKFEEISSWLENSGFRNIQLKPAGNGRGVITAQK